MCKKNVIESGSGSGNPGFIQNFKLNVNYFGYVFSYHATLIGMNDMMCLTNSSWYGKLFHVRYDAIMLEHYCDVIMGVTASQITSLTTVYSTVNLGADQRKQQNFASLAFWRGIHRWPVNSPHKGPVTWKLFPFDDVIMSWADLAAGDLDFVSEECPDNDLVTGRSGQTAFVTVELPRVVRQQGGQSQRGYICCGAWGWHNMELFSASLEQYNMPLIITTLVNTWLCVYY